MTNNNRELWTELGIDLKQHDILLSALGPIYKEIYLSQKKRPNGMGFFDFVVGDIHGIRVRKLKQHAKNGRPSGAESSGWAKSWLLRKSLSG